MYPTCANARSFRHTITRLMLALLASVWLPACAQTPEQPAPGVVSEPVFTAEEISELVAPIALYPDDLLAIVLPASTYPLQIVEAQRFLEAAANDPSRKPPEDWDDSVVALLNYPEVVKLMNDDLDWTQALGEAVLAQQPEVLAAIEGFRKRAYTSGNLRSDDRQVVAVQDDAIRIRPANPQIIYVPYYEPAAVTVFHTAPAYYYYPRPYPVYYYPYPADYVFATGFFWGVTTFYTLGWHTHHVHVYDYDYYDHPYYGRPYYHHRHYYRRPPPPRVGHGYRVNDGSWERHEYPRDGDRQYYDRDGDRTPDGYTAENRDQDGVTPAVRAPDDTYWRPDYRHTGARPGTDPRRALYRRGEPRQQRVAQPAPQEPGSGTDQPAPPAAQPVPAETERRPGEPRGPGAREQDRNRPDEPTNGATDKQPGSVDPRTQRAQTREGSWQQRMEAQRRGVPPSDPSRDGVPREPQTAQEQELRRLERQEQEQARRQIEQQERDQRQLEQEQQREQSRQRHEQSQREQAERQLEQREQGRQRYEQEQRERTQRQFEQQEREQTQRQSEQQRYRQEQSEREQRQYEQRREQEQRRYQPDSREQESRQQEQRRYEQESRDRDQQSFQQRQFAPQSWQQRQSVPQQRSAPEVRMQPRPVEAPRNYRSESGAQRVERAAPQPQQRQVETRPTQRAEPRGERSDGHARSDGDGGESGGRSFGREANGSWMRH